MLIEYRSLRQAIEILWLFIFILIIVFLLLIHEVLFGFKRFFGGDIYLHVKIFPFSRKTVLKTKNPFLETWTTAAFIRLLRFVSLGYLNRFLCLAVISQHQKPSKGNGMGAVSKSLFVFSFPPLKNLWLRLAKCSLIGKRRRTPLKYNSKKSKEKGKWAQRKGKRPAFPSLFIRRKNKNSPNKREWGNVTWISSFLLPLPKTQRILRGKVGNSFSLLFYWYS